ncbi:hypothetical protein GQ53DRAFT_754038 [Thozetella sp. PMI_491]|nr:hypothetical protein GQ53DRAFT_754038 [Thozetella sp. PMI_491]
MAYRTPLALLFACVFLSFGAGQVCYDATGSADKNLLPCNPNDKISPCCSISDVCLSNGLCLDLGSDNSFTTQGCTDQSWASPCISNCKASTAASGTGLYPYLIQCNAATMQPRYCCGLDVSCCNATFNLPLFKSVSAAPNLSTSAASSSTAASSTTSGPASSATAPTGDSGGNSATTIGVGVGVGVGVGLLVFTALVFLGLQIRKRNRAASESAAMTHYEPSPTTGTQSMSHYHQDQNAGIQSAYPSHYDTPVEAPSSIHPVELSAKP